MLIYKTPGVLNFAQGAMLLFAALTFVGLIERGISLSPRFLITLAIMVVPGVSVERAVPRPLVNQPPITLFMATLGLSFVHEDAAAGGAGSRPRRRHQRRYDSTSRGLH
ncbi:hypothetical protein CI41S_67640 [Bradyrhizobium ivorense]|nr:hypothetical protein CI41S_67640 [Bradyrhizobium ivorense]